MQQRNVRVMMEIYGYEQQSEGESGSLRVRHSNEAMGVQILTEGCLM